MMTLQLSACSFKCQNKPQDHSYKVPLLPLLLPAAPRCLIFFPRLTPMHAPPGMPHFYMHAPPRGGLIFLPCLTTTHAPPRGGWRMVPRQMPRQVRVASASAGAGALFFSVSHHHACPPRGGGWQVLLRRVERQVQCLIFFSVSHYHA